MAIDTENRTYETWAEAFMIFAKYEPNTFGQVSAGHEIIYAGPNPEKVSVEDLARLEQIGWHPDYNQYECFYRFT